MKRILVTTFLCILAVASFAQGGKYTMKGDLGFFLQEYEAGAVVDSVYVEIDRDNDKWDITGYKVENNFLNIKGKTDNQYLATLTIKLNVPGGKGTSYMPFILESGNMTINKDGWAEGTPANDTLYKFFLEQYQVFEKKRTQNEIADIVKRYIQNPNNDKLLAIWLSSAPRYMNLPIILDIIESAHPQIQKHYLVKQRYMQYALINGIQNYKSPTAVGEKFKDFTVTYEGNEQKLSDYVGNGKYMIVDFWASWCAPCRAEIPKLIDVYNKYKGDNFGVLGVALNDNPINSKKLINKMEIPYPQILNAQNKVGELYDIDGIPEIILFAPDGTILARGLRGPNIEKAVKEALEQHKNSK